MTCQIYGQAGIICVFLFLLAIEIALLFRSVLKSCFKSGLLPILIWSLKSCFSQQKYHSLSLLMTKSVLSPKRRKSGFYPFFALFSVCLRTNPGPTFFKFRVCTLSVFSGKVVDGQSFFTYRCQHFSSRRNYFEEKPIGFTFLPDFIHSSIWTSL